MPLGIRPLEFKVCSANNAQLTTQSMESLELKWTKPVTSSTRSVSQSCPTESLSPSTSTPESLSTALQSGTTPWNLRSFKTTYAHYHLPELSLVVGFAQIY